MKYVKTFESFRDNRKVVNEEFLGAIGKFFGNMFKKLKQSIDKTKGGNDVEEIYQKYIKMISDEFTKNAQVSLNLLAVNKQTINEAVDEVAFDGDIEDTKLAVDTLNKKKSVLDQIVVKMKQMAVKEMDAVLQKYGGASANPQLAIIINSKKDQFELDYLNAQIKYLEESGDKTLVNDIIKKRDIVAKKIENDFKDFDAVKAVQYKEGDDVIYLLKDKKVEWDKLDKNKQDEIIKDTSTEDAKKMVDTNKILKVDNGTFTLSGKDGMEIIKSSGEILGLSQVKDGETEIIEYKVGDKVVYKRNSPDPDNPSNFNEEDWNKVSDNDKKKSEEGPMKDLRDKGQIGIKVIKTIDGDNITFEDADFKKTLSDILMKIETTEDTK